jgi:predicted nucleic acid-binding protein
MIEPIFIDTGAFFATKCSSDKNNQIALSYYNSICERGKYNLVITNLVIFETVTLSKGKIGIDFAIEFGKYLRNSEFIKIIKITEELENKSWDIFDTYNDKEYSFTDCSSFAVMKKFVIRKAFAFDKHFEQFGFEINPK